MKPAFETLLTAAVWAPSGDNTQPWRFEVDEEASTIAVYVDPTRDPSPMNAGQRMARIAVGAAVENILRTAAYNGWTAELLDDVGDAEAVIHLPDVDDQPGEIEDVVLRRCTNRKLYDGRPLQPELLAELQATPPEFDGIELHWITDRPRIEKLADLIGQADALMFSIKEVRTAFIANVRFPMAQKSNACDGLPLVSLELRFDERMATRLLKYIPNWLFRATGSARKFRRKASSLIHSASALCAVSISGCADATELRVGRTVQAIWLALTAQSFAVQPMMSLPVLRNLTDHQECWRTIEPSVPAINEIERGFTDCLNLGDERIAFLLRIGYSPLPSGRATRRPIKISSLQKARCEKTKTPSDLLATGRLE